MKPLLLLAGVLISQPVFAEPKTYLVCQSSVSDFGQSNIIKGPDGRVEVDQVSGEAFFSGHDPQSQIGFVARYLRSKAHVAVKTAIGPSDVLAYSSGHALAGGAPLVMKTPFLFRQDSELTIQCGVVLE